MVMEEPTHRLEEQASIPHPTLVLHPLRQLTQRQLNLTQHREHLYISFLFLR
jgi:hypothetical protein